MFENYPNAMLVLNRKLLTVVVWQVIESHMYVTRETVLNTHFVSYEWNKVKLAKFVGQQ